MRVGRIRSGHAVILAGTSLVVLTGAASAQQSGASVRLDELSVESQGAGAPSSTVAGGAGNAPLRGGENPLGPVAGYVATRSVTATKTNTPLIEAPQSITVVGRQQLDTQNAQTLTQATQYVAGTFAGTFGADTRNTFVYLRGFNVSDYGIYRTGCRR